MLPQVTIKNPWRLCCPLEAGKGELAICKNKVSSFKLTVIECCNMRVLDRHPHQSSIASMTDAPTVKERMVPSRVLQRIVHDL